MGYKMARHWAPLRDPQIPETRSRSISRVGSVGSQWGQRPLFSEPSEDQLPPEQGNMGREGRPDDIHPSDGRQSSDETATLVKAESLIPVKFSFSKNNVASPPTAAQLTAAFGSKREGEAFIVFDAGAGAAWFIVRGVSGVWEYVALTSAV